MIKLSSDLTPMKIKELDNKAKLVLQRSTLSSFLGASFLTCFLVLCFGIVVYFLIHVFFFEKINLLNIVGVLVLMFAFWHFSKGALKSSKRMYGETITFDKQSEAVFRNGMRICGTTEINRIEVKERYDSDVGMNYDLILSYDQDKVLDIDSGLDGERIYTLKNLISSYYQPQT